MLSALVPSRLANRSDRYLPLLAAALISLAAFIAYRGSLNSPFVFDDQRAILENPTIRHLWPVTTALTPPHDGGGVTGRPLINLSLALNFAFGGTAVRGYHVFNVGIHVLAALALFGLLRRTLLRAIPQDSDSPTISPRPRWRISECSLAFIVALLWTLHPLQTESVTCIVQRTESIAGLFYLLTLYLFARGLEGPHPAAWLVASVAACLAGMASKEIMVTAPVAVLLYDRTFAAGSFREAWRRRKAVHLALAATWLLLAGLMLGSPQRAGTAGFGLGVTAWEYLLTQCRALALYLKLSLWPHPLVVDYGTTLARHPGEVLPQAALILLLLLGTGIALWRRPALGFVGACFFLTLAPSSSFVPLVSQTIAEHRMYLPLAAVLAALVLGGYRLFGPRSAVACLLLALPFGSQTAHRNKVYASDLALWTDTVGHRPENPRAHINLGNALLDVNRIDEAIAHYEIASRLPGLAAASHLSLAGAYTRAGQSGRAIAHGEAAVRLSPHNPDAEINLGLALVAAGRAAEALPHYEAALGLEPHASDTRAYLATALLQLGRPAEAVGQCQAALELDPDRADTWCILARALAQQHDSAAARRAAERALQLRPDFPEALFVLGNLDAANEDFAQAIRRYRRSLALAPTYAAARTHLANVLLMSGKVDEAIAEYRQVLGQRPDDHLVQKNLARALELQALDGTRPSPLAPPSRTNAPPLHADPASSASPTRSRE